MFEKVFVEYFQRFLLLAEYELCDIQIVCQQRSFELTTAIGVDVFL
jgi:hypothetical protein